jgi:hypothetical protein
MCAAYRTPSKRLRGGSDGSLSSVLMFVSLVQHDSDGMALAKG